MTSVTERTVLAIYFDKNKKVVDKALYGAKDGKSFTIEGRKTPSYGQDRNFVDSLISSI
jgi:outer membrane protein assembly factor BamE (lipoprotein component of BamABCDE complex)